MEIVDEPILDKQKIRFILDALDKDFYSQADKEKFTDIIYRGFSDPYNYDTIYADFLSSHFHGQAFAAESAKSIVQEKMFHKMFIGRGSDEEYHSQVLKWNLDNLRLRFYADDNESLVYLVSVLSERYQTLLPDVERNEFPNDYWARIHKFVSDKLDKSLLIEDGHFGLYLSDNDKADELIEILREIDLNLVTQKSNET